MTAQLVLTWLASTAHGALGPGPTTTLDSGVVTDSGDTGLQGHTGGEDTDTPTVDSGAPFCPECTGAAGLAGEDGGSPCASGCDHAAAPALTLAGLAVLVGARRRRPVRR